MWFKQLQHAATRFTSHDAGFETANKRGILEGWQLEWGGVDTFSSSSMPIGNDIDIAIFILSDRHIGCKLKCHLFELLPDYEC